jgi:hypothetical protein
MGSKIYQIASACDMYHISFNRRKIGYTVKKTSGREIWTRCEAWSRTVWLPFMAMMMKDGPYPWYCVCLLIAFEWFYTRHSRFTNSPSELPANDLYFFTNTEFLCVFYSSFGFFAECECYWWNSTVSFFWMIGRLN